MQQDSGRQRNLLHAVAMWWDADENRLRLIRLLAYLLFAASIGATIYSAIRSVLPLWVMTLYAAFVVQLVFMTFMYAIRHSSVEEIRRAVFDLRRSRIAQWRFEREMLAELMRFMACTAHGIDPRPPTRNNARRTLRQSKAPWPTSDVQRSVSAYIRGALLDTDRQFAHDDSPASSDDTIETSSPSDSPQPPVLRLKFVAYSAETLINLTRDICADIDEALQEGIQPAYATGHTFEVRVQILIRDTTQGYEWLVPLASDQQKDRQYAADLRTRFRNVQRSALKEFEETLKDLVSPRKVDFRVRVYQLEPLIKGLIVNESQGLFGLYTVSELMDPRGWDFSGHAVNLLPFDTEASFVDETLASLFLNWFDQLWQSDELSRPVDF